VAFAAERLSSYVEHWTKTSKLDSQRLQIFQQRLLFVGSELRAEFVAATAITRISVAAIGRVQCIVKFGLLGREPNVHLIVCGPDEGMR
jgi:hypothetical protein